METRNRRLIRLYSQSQDEGAVYALWLATLDRLWPLAFDTFQTATTRRGEPATYHHFVVYEGHRLAGAILCQTARSAAGEVQAGILALLVAPADQRRGLGRALLVCATSHLRRLGVTTLHLGRGGDAYFWPGVPENLPEAVLFFRRCGWRFTEILYDMVGDLRDFSFDPRWLERVGSHGFTIRQAVGSDIPPLTSFECTQFPNWWPSFQTEIDAGRLDNIVIAVTAQGEVVGSATLFTNDNRIVDNGLAWSALLGEDMGGFGVLGVRADQRGQGIGLALAAEATRLLQARGVRHSFVGWTYLEEMYGKLGYKIWRRYHMSAPWRWE